MSTECFARQLEVFANPRIVRPQTERFHVAGDGLPRLPLQQKHIAEIDVRFRVGGLEPHRGAQMFDSGRQAAGASAMPKPMTADRTLACAAA